MAAFLFAGPDRGGGRRVHERLETSSPLRRTTSLDVVARVGRVAYCLTKVPHPLFSKSCPALRVTVGTPPSGPSFSMMSLPLLPLR